MHRRLSQGWSTALLAASCVGPAALATPALAGHHHDKPAKYEVVQGFILQPAAPAQLVQAATPAPLQAQATAASPQAPSTTSPAPQASVQLQLAPTAQPQAQPTVQLQLAAAPAPAPTQTITLQMVQAPVQPVQVQLATVHAVQPIQLQAVAAPVVSFAPALSLAPTVQAAGASVATPVQLLIPQRKCHLFGH